MFPVTTVFLQGIIKDAPLQKKPEPPAPDAKQQKVEEVVIGDSDSSSSSSSSSSEDEKRKKKKKKHKKEKKKKHKKEKKKKKDKKRHRGELSEKETKQETVKKSRKSLDEDVPPHLGMEDKKYVLCLMLSLIIHHVSLLDILMFSKFLVLLSGIICRPSAHQPRFEPRNSRLVGPGDSSSN